MSEFAPEIQEFRPPGAGKRKARIEDRGRRVERVEEAARSEVRALLGDRPRRRDLLIAHRRLQHRRDAA